MAGVKNKSKSGRGPGTGLGLMIEADVCVTARPTRPVHNAGDYHTFWGLGARYK